jgi:hypothetical protein
LASFGRGIGLTTSKNTPKVGFNLKIEENSEFWQQHPANLTFFTMMKPIYFLTDMNHLKA